MAATAVGAATPEPNDRETKQERALAPFRDFLEILKPYPSGEYHLLVPTIYQERSPLFRPVLSVVKVNAEDPRAVYPTPGGGSTLCLHSYVLEQIGNAMGIEWNATRFDADPKEPYLVTAHVSGWHTDLAGLRRAVSASATCDYREGSIGAKVLKGGLDVARQFIRERTESRARNRLIRKLANIPSSFRKDELAKPFVAVRARLDESDAEVKRAVIATSLGAAAAVFGQPAPALEAGHARPEEEIAEGEFSEQPEAAAPKEDPEPVDEEALAPAAAAAQAAVTPERAAAIRGHVEELRKGMRWGKDAREKQPTPQQAGLSVTSIAAAIAEPKQLTADQKKVVWRAVMEQLFGPFGSFVELSSDQVSVATDWAKANAGEVRELVTFLAQSNERVAEVRVALEGQQTLIGGGA